MLPKSDLSTFFGFLCYIWSKGERKREEIEICEFIFGNCQAHLSMSSPCPQNLSDIFPIYNMFHPFLTTLHLSAMVTNRVNKIVQHQCQGWAMPWLFHRPEQSLHSHYCSCSVAFISATYLSAAWLARRNSARRSFRRDVFRGGLCNCHFHFWNWRAESAAMGAGKHRSPLTVHCTGGKAVNQDKAVFLISNTFCGCNGPLRWASQENMIS